MEPKCRNIEERTVESKRTRQIRFGQKKLFKANLNSMLWVQNYLESTNFWVQKHSVLTWADQKFVEEKHVETLKTLFWHCQDTFLTLSRHPSETVNTSFWHCHDTLQTLSRHPQDTPKKHPTHLPDTLKILEHTFRNLPDTYQTPSRHLQTPVSHLTDTPNILKIPPHIIESTSIISKWVFS